MADADDHTSQTSGGLDLVAAPGLGDGRLDLYRYVTSENAAEYVALMRLFTGTLLADLSAADAHEMLANTGVVLSTDDVEIRCRQLEAWGNPVRSIRDARVATVSEWLRSRSRSRLPS